MRITAEGLLLGIVVIVASMWSVVLLLRQYFPVIVILAVGYFIYRHYHPKQSPSNHVHKND